MDDGVSPNAPVYDMRSMLSEVVWHGRWGRDWRGVPSASDDAGETPSAPTLDIQPAPVDAVWGSVLVMVFGCISTPLSLAVQISFALGSQTCVP